MSSRHAEAPRGLIQRKDAIEPPKWNNQGRFGRLFEPASPQFKDGTLEKLATAMVAEFDAPKDGPDEEESAIPALYTYFGQFVDHDLVFDPETSFQRQKDANALVDFRTPAFDLDSVYGRGPGDQPMVSDWGIDWGRFIDIDERRYDGSDLDKSRRLQLAYRIDTSLVDPLGSLPPTVAAKPSSLALRNLQRGTQLGLPSGQAVAEAMQRRDLPIKVLDDEEIIIGKAVGGREGQAITKVDSSFKCNCPLWTYVLAEAMRHAVDVSVPVAENRERPRAVTIKTPQLGPVGGRIVAEVIVGLMFADPFSVLREEWQPETGPGYALRDLVTFALG
jgi:hypothetical protein